jgi:hypothetical protein
MKSRLYKSAIKARPKLCAFIFGCGLTLVQSVAIAQSALTGMQNATTEVKGYFTAGTNLMYAIGAIVGIVGAVKVYNKWNAGDQDTMKTASSWFGSCIFLIVVTAMLKGFFNIP